RCRSLDSKLRAWCGATPPCRSPAWCEARARTTTPSSWSPSARAGPRASSERSGAMYISAIATRQLEIGIGNKAFSFSFGGVNMDLPTITGRPERGITDSLPLVAGADPTLVRAAFGLALHMHQPTVLGDGDRVTAPL